MRTINLGEDRSVNRHLFSLAGQHKDLIEMNNVSAEKMGATVWEGKL